MTGVSPTGATAAEGVDTGTVSVSAPAGCTWTSSSDAGWLTVGTSGGTGNGNVGWTTAANTGAARVGHVIVSGRSVTVTQDPASGPDGTVVIDDDAISTRTTSVRLTFDAPGAAQVCVSNTASCSSWRALSSPMSWSLSGGEGQNADIGNWKRED